MVRLQVICSDHGQWPQGQEGVGSMIWRPRVSSNSYRSQMSMKVTEGSGSV